MKAIADLESEMRSLHVRFTLAIRRMVKETGQDERSAFNSLLTDLMNGSRPVAVAYLNWLKATASK